MVELATRNDNLFDVRILPVSEFNGAASAYSSAAELLPPSSRSIAVL